MNGFPGEQNITSNLSKRFLESTPFYYSLYYADKYNCDISILNNDGIGNLIVYTRLIEELSMSKGKQLKILTAPINPQVGIVPSEEDYPIWKFNPFISEIVNANTIDGDIMQKVNHEQDNFCQFNHMIESICNVFGLRPRQLKPSLFLSYEEMKWGLEQLAHLQRPIICLHPSGKSSVAKDSPWYIAKWKSLISKFEGIASFIQVGKLDFDKKQLPIFNLQTTIREAMSLIWASDFFVGFDSSLAHMATAFEKPSLVLWNILIKNELEEPYQTGFGPASLLRWAYPQNRNIMLLGEKKDEILDLVIEFIHEQITTINRRSKLLDSNKYLEWLISNIKK